MATDPPAVPVKCAGPSPPTTARIRVEGAMPKTAQKGCPGRLWGQEGHVAAGHQRRQHTCLGVCRCPYMICLGNRPTYRTGSSLMWPSACPRSTPSPTCRCASAGHLYGDQGLLHPNKGTFAPERIRCIWCILVYFRRILVYFGVFSVFAQNTLEVYSRVLENPV